MLTLTIRDRIVLCNRAVDQRLAIEVKRNGCASRNGHAFRDIFKQLDRPSSLHRVDRSLQGRIALTVDFGHIALSRQRRHRKHGQQHRQCKQKR